jgi:hypothetical protein
MHPLVLLGLGALGGVVANSALEKARQKKIQADLARQQVLDLSAKELIQGQNYAVTMEIDPTDPSFGGVRDVATAQRLIKATLQAPGGTGGWLFAGDAAPRDAANQRLFLAGRPSEWAFAGRWTRPEKFVTQKPGWLTQAVPFLLPAT